MHPKRSNETAVLAEGVGAADEDYTLRQLRIELGHGRVSGRYPLRLNLGRSAKPEECHRRTRYPIRVDPRDPPDRRDL